MSSIARSATILAALTFAALLGGCCSAEAKRQVVLREAEAARFVQLVDQGQTTRDQEQRFIRATKDAWAAFREALGAKGVK